MQTNSVEAVRIVPSQLRAPQLSSEQVQQRIELFTGDRMEAGTAIQTDDATIALPPSDAESRATIQNIFQNATSEQQATLAELGNQLFHGLSSSSGAANADINPTLDMAVQQVVHTTGSANVNQVVQGVISLAVEGAEAEMLGFATDLEANIDEKAELRVQITELGNDITDLSGQIAAWPDDGSEQTVHYSDVDGNPLTATVTLEDAKKILTDMNKAKEMKETQLQTLGDMTQMMQMNLQDALNKQQQAIQMLSNIIAKANKTAETIISNMK